MIPDGPGVEPAGTTPRPDVGLSPPPSPVPHDSGDGVTTKPASELCSTEQSGSRPAAADQGDSTTNHVDPISTHTFAPGALTRVRDRCERRRSATKGGNDFCPFPTVTAKPSWIDQQFDWQGRVLVEKDQQSGAKPLGCAWFIGDVHGDLVGLLAALEFIRSQKEYRDHDIIVLLGDLIDDLAESHEVLAEVSERLQRDERLLVIAGNHDVALEYCDERGFGASVDPSDFSRYLQQLWECEESIREVSHRLARSFIEYIANAPVALFLRDGTIVAHGGVPHTDMTQKVLQENWGELPEVWSDFIWARLHPRAKRRIAVTGTRSRELGAADFHAFTEVMGTKLGFKPTRMIRGHDHIDERFEIYGGPWKGAVLTINSMSWKLPREIGVDGPRDPCVAQWRPNEPIQPYVIKLDRAWRAGLQPGSLA